MSAELPWKSWQTPAVSVFFCLETILIAPVVTVVFAPGTSCPLARAPLPEEPPARLVESVFSSCGVISIRGVDASYSTMTPAPEPTVGFEDRTGVGSDSRDAIGVLGMLVWAQGEVLWLGSCVRVTTRLRTSIGVSARERRVTLLSCDILQVVSARRTAICPQRYARNVPQVLERSRRYPG